MQLFEKLAKEITRSLFDQYSKLNVLKSNFLQTDNEEDLYDVKLEKLNCNIASFEVTKTKGVGLQLPCGVKLVFPADCYNFNADKCTFYCKVVAPEDHQFVVNDFDQILSVLLQMGPDGMHFKKVSVIPISFFSKQIRF